MHQHVGAGGAIGLRSIFELIVADTVLAGNEHHSRRHYRVEVAGVVAGARRDAAVRIAELLSGILDRIDSLVYVAPLFFHYLRYRYGLYNL